MLEITYSRINLPPSRPILLPSPITHSQIALHNLSKYGFGIPPAHTPSECPQNILLQYHLSPIIGTNLITEVRPLRGNKRVCSEQAEYYSFPATNPPGYFYTSSSPTHHIGTIEELRITIFGDKVRQLTEPQFLKPLYPYSEIPFPLPSLIWEGKEYVSIKFLGYGSSLRDYYISKEDEDNLLSLSLKSGEVKPLKKKDRSNNVYVIRCMDVNLTVNLKQLRITIWPELLAH